MVEPTEIDLDGWQLDPQILTQTAKSHPSSSCPPARHGQARYLGARQPCTVGQWLTGRTPFRCSVRTSDRSRRSTSRGRVGSRVQTMRRSIRPGTSNRSRGQSSTNSSRSTRSHLVSRCPCSCRCPLSRHVWERRVRATSMPRRGHPAPAEQCWRRGSRKSPGSCATSASKFPTQHCTCSGRRLPLSAAACCCGRRSSAVQRRVRLTRRTRGSEWRRSARSYQRLGTQTLMRRSARSRS